MEEETSKESRFLKVELGNYTAPSYVDYKNKEYITWGKYNEHPQFLLDLVSYHPEHAAVVRGKAAYIFGKGLKLESSDTVLDNAKNQVFLENANRFENWNEVVKKTIPNYQVYNGFTWQIIWNNGGTAFETYFIEMGKLRRSKCGKKVFYCDEWTIIDNYGYWVENANPEKSDSYKSFDLFNPNIRTGTQIYWYTQDFPDVTKYGKFYPKEEYGSAIREIETDIEISKLRYNYSKHGMFAQSLITFFNGEPDAKEKKAIKKMFDRTYGGADNAGQLIFSFSDKGGTAPNIDTLTQSDLDKVFADTRKECQDKIFSAHLASPVLFGIQTSNGISNNSAEQIVKEWEKFVKTYIEYRQYSITSEIEKLGFVMGYDLELAFEQTSPVGLDLPSDPNILILFNDATKKAYYAKKYGIELVDDVLSDGTAPVTPLSAVNEHLKKISGKDWIHIKRMIRDVQNGKVTREVGSMMLRNAYALTDDDINTLFGTPPTQFKKFEIETRDRTDELLNLFELYAIDDNDDEIVSEKFIDLHSQNFATEKENSDFIIEALQGNPLATPEALAKQLGLSTDEVLTLIAAMVATGLLLNTGAAYQPTEKAIAKKLDPTEIETYTVYAYVTRPDVPEVETTSRKFCKRLLKMTREGKRWSKESIDNMSNEFGESAWTFKGGFYTNPDTQETTTYCRHIWRQITKSRKKKS